jgi:hypothetical protein
VVMCCSDVHCLSVIFIFSIQVWFDCKSLVDSRGHELH